MRHPSARVTGDRRYLEQARFFLEQRGRHAERPLYQYAGNPSYCQDHLPVCEQKEAVGHAVRAMYMYCGMADVAAMMPDPAYSEAVRRIWQDVVASKIYLTGGVGARHMGEAFGEAYELPNDTAYAETCAAIGSVMWNHRLFLQSGESRYIDVLEQGLYNALLAGVSLDGTEFFYVNPLASDGRFAFNHGAAARRPWFDVSCCPTNLCRFFPSLPGYIYAVAGDDVYVNLYAGSRTSVQVAGIPFVVEQRTSYPWSGHVEIRVEPRSPVRMRLKLRIPGWTQQRIMGADLYRFQTSRSAGSSATLNHEPWGLEMEKGYVVIDRVWSGSEVVELDLPMPVRLVLCDSRVAENRGRVALQRGPIVYCVEERDCDGPVDAVAAGRETDFTVGRGPSVLGGIVTMRGPGFTAIPYYAWANRGPGPMRVWLRES